jgi:hypothetical protein
LLESVELSNNLDLLVCGGRSGYVAALAARILRRGRVTVVEENPAIRDRTQKNLDALGITNASVLPTFDPGEAAFDRIIVTSPAVPTTLPRKALNDMGILLAPLRTTSGIRGTWTTRAPETRNRGGAEAARPQTPDARPQATGIPPQTAGVEFLRVLRSGDDWAELRFGASGFPPPQPSSRWRGAAGNDRTLSYLWRLEELLREAWSDTVKSGGSREFNEVTEKTIWRGLVARGIAKAAPARARVARGAFHMGYIFQMTGDAANATECYTASLKTVATAEAYTFRGWTASFGGDYDTAIEDCHLAIATDPEFGNPYNDIGAYLIELGRPEEAITWFERALGAGRYESPFFPHTNLGRVHMMKGDKERAKKSFLKALELNPAYEPAKRFLEMLEQGGSA